MPNYRYHSPDYARRTQRGQSRGPVQIPASCPETACPVCRDDKYDELTELPLAMAYVPWQAWRNLYEPEKGFQRGTIFEELDKPFRGMGGCQNAR